MRLLDHEIAGLVRWEGGGMSHEIAKLLLEHAETFLERTEAIKSAISLGMPIAEIEEYLDWLDNMRGRRPPETPSEPPQQPNA